MTHLLYSDVEMGEQMESPSIFGGGATTGSTALLRPDSDEKDQPSDSERWSDYSIGSSVLAPICARGDDLDNDEAYFLEDEDDDDEDIDDDYDDDDDEDDEDDQSAADSDEEDDDEEL